jgi:hypothetical protein
VRTEETTTSAVPVFPLILGPHSIADPQWPLVLRPHGFSVLNQDVASFKAAWRNFVRFIAGFIAAMGVIVPVAALAGMGYVPGRKYWRKR